MAENGDYNPHQTNGSGGDLIWLLIMALLTGAVAFAVLLLLIYSLILLSVAGAMYMGVKMGAAGSGATLPWDIPEYKQIHEIERKRLEHLANLPKDDDEVREIADESFQERKIRVYRPKTDDRPIVNFDVDAFKERLRRRGKK